MKTLRIEGKDYPCRMTMGALLRYKRLTGKEAATLKPEDTEGLIVLVYCAVLSACAADGVEMAWDLVELADRLEPDALHDFYAAAIDEKKTTPAPPQAT